MSRFVGGIDFFWVLADKEMMSIWCRPRGGIRDTTPNHAKLVKRARRGVFGDDFLGLLPFLLSLYQQVLGPFALVSTTTGTGHMISVPLSLQNAVNVFCSVLLSGVHELFLGR